MAIPIEVKADGEGNTADRRRDPRQFRRLVRKLQHVLIIARCINDLKGNHDHDHDHGDEAGRNSSIPVADKTFGVKNLSEPALSANPPCVPEDVSDVTHSWLSQVVTLHPTEQEETLKSLLEATWVQQSLSSLEGSLDQYVAKCSSFVTSVKSRVIGKLNSPFWLGWAVKRNASRQDERAQALLLRFMMGLIMMDMRMLILEGLFAAYYTVCSEYRPLERMAEVLSRTSSIFNIGWFFEWPSGRQPLNSTWPWADVKPSLLVLWGVCWMFYSTCFDALATQRPNLASRDRPQLQTQQWRPTSNDYPDIHLAQAFNPATDIVSQPWVPAARPLPSAAPRIPLRLCQPTMDFDLLASPFLFAGSGSLNSSSAVAQAGIRADSLMTSHFVQPGLSMFSQPVTAPPSYDKWSDDLFSWKYGSLGSNCDSGSTINREFQMGLAQHGLARFSQPEDVDTSQANNNSSNIRTTPRQLAHPQNKTANMTSPVTFTYPSLEGMNVHDSRAFMTQDRDFTHLPDQMYEQPHDPHDGLSRYPSPPQGRSDDPYGTVTQQLVDAAQGGVPDIIADVKSESENGSPSRSKPIPKPDREVTKLANGRFYCNWPGCTEEIKDFGRKCEWSKHMDKHDRPYKCLAEGCEKLPGFTYSGGLLRHEREVHNKHGGPRKHLNCPHSTCKRHTGKGFSRQENLNEHMRRVHTDVVPGHEGGETEDEVIQAPTTTKRKRTGLEESDESVASKDEQIKRLKQENEELRRQAENLTHQSQDIMRQMLQLQANQMQANQIGAGMRMAPAAQMT